MRFVSGAGSELLYTRLELRALLGVRPRLVADQNAVGVDDYVPREGFNDENAHQIVEYRTLMPRRYETASTVLTSNKSFEEWGTVFGDEVMAAALVNRLLHHCHVVSIRGNSYRLLHQRSLWRSLKPDDEPSESADNLTSSSNLQTHPS